MSYKNRLKIIQSHKIIFWYTVNAKIILIFIMDQFYFMERAIQEALRAFDEGEVPVGAVIERDGAVIGRGYNRVEALGDATAHAEIIAMTAASNHLGDWRLNGCTLYVTLEPCLMCLGAILQSRVSAVVYGAKDIRLGGIDSFHYRAEAERAYKSFPQITSGVMEAEAGGLLKSFFRKLRGRECP